MNSQLGGRMRRSPRDGRDGTLDVGGGTQLRLLVLPVAEKLLLVIAQQRAGAGVVHGAAVAVAVVPRAVEPPVAPIAVAQGVGQQVVDGRGGSHGRARTRQCKAGGPAATKVSLDGSWGITGLAHPGRFG